jgi:hypothetical protein
MGTKMLFLAGGGYTRNARAQLISRQCPRMAMRRISDKRDCGSGLGYIHYLLDDEQEMIGHNTAQKYIDSADHIDEIVLRVGVEDQG